MGTEQKISQNLNLNSGNLSESSLKGKSLEEMAGLFRSVIKEKQLRNLNLGTYSLFKLISDDPPSRIPSEAYHNALLATESNDNNTKRLGREVFLYLTARTILNVVDTSFKKGDTKEDREEMFDSAALSVMSITSESSQKSPISVQVFHLAQLGIFTYLCEKYNIPLDFDYRLQRKNIWLIRKIAELKDIGNLTNEKIKNIAQEMSEKSGIPIANLLDFLTFRGLMVEREVGDYTKAKDYSDVEREIDVRNALSTLSDSHRKVLEELFGTTDGVGSTEAEVGKELHLTPAAVSLTKIRAIRILRHSSRREKFRGYLNRHQKNNMQKRIKSH